MGGYGDGSPHARGQREGMDSSLRLHGGRLFAGGTGMGSRLRENNGGGGAGMGPRIREDNVRGMEMRREWRQQNAGEGKSVRV